MTGQILWGMAVLVLLAPTAARAASRTESDAFIVENVPDIPRDRAEALSAYLSAREATPLGWSPQGELLIATRFGEVSQLHAVAQPGGARRQITFRREGVAQAVVSPDPLHPGFVFGIDGDGSGDGPTQLYYQRWGQDTGTARPLTDVKSTSRAPVWSNAGHALAFSSTAADGVSRDIDVVEPEAGTLPHLVMTGDRDEWIPLDWSPDDRRLLVLRTVSADEGAVYVVDLDSGQRREIAAGSKAAVSGAKFSRDGQGIFLISNRDTEYAALSFVNLFTPERTVLSAHANGEVETMAVSGDGHYLAYVTNVGGTDQLDVLDLRTHQDRPPPRLPGAGLVDHLRFDSTGKRLAFAFDPGGRPRDAYVLDLETNRVDEWTQSEAAGAAGAAAARPRLAQFPTFDRVDGRVREEPAYVYEPVKPGPHPVLVLLHDGPAAEYRPAFDPWLAFVVDELGYAVVAPNLRGSAGYGKTYRALDNGTQRDDVLKDLGALIVWVDAQAAFDAKHVIAAGSGYGGYLALSALVNYGDRLQGAVDIGGMPDLISFLTGSGAQAQGRLRAEYGDERDLDTRSFLRRISPLTNADRIAKPVLIAHGRRESQVPIGESLQLVNRLRSRGGSVWFVEGKEAGADFDRHSERETLYRSIASFLLTVR